MFNTGWHSKWNSRKADLGSKQTNNIPFYLCLCLSYAHMNVTVMVNITFSLGTAFLKKKKKKYTLNSKESILITETKIVIFYSTCRKTSNKKIYYELIKCQLQQWESGTQKELSYSSCKFYERSPFYK